MSVFTNPADGAAADAENYIRATLELLGDRDPLAVLDETPGWLQERAEHLGHELLTRPEAPGKWSIAATMQHLADSELVWGYRLRMVLAEDRPSLSGYDQDRWADRLHYDAADAWQAAADFAVLRASNRRLLGAASEDDLERVSVHSERGEESVRHMIRLYAGHDLVHRNQIERIKGSQEKRGHHHGHRC